jgi:hypothetical protein
MPQLSPAAREQSMMSSGSSSGAFRQDSALLRAEYMQRSGRMSKQGSSRLSPTVMAAPTATGTGSGGSGSDSSSSRNPFQDPAAIPTRPSVPSAPGARPTGETKRMTSQTERTPMSEQKSSRSGRNESAGSKGMLSNPVVRIILESIIVFGLALLFWWILHSFGVV